MIFKPFRRLFFNTSAYTFIIAGINLLVLYFFPALIYKYQWQLIIYFYLITIISLIIVERSIRKSSSDITTGFFGAMMVRMFLSVIIALVIIYFDRESSIIFAVNFMILYFLYLGYEIYYLITNLQPRLNSKNDVE